MENQEPTVESEQPETVASPEIPIEPTKIKDVVKEVPSKTDATEPEISDEEKPSQNGEIEPQVTLNGEKTDKPADPAEESKEETKTDMESESNEEPKHVDESVQNDKPETSDEPIQNDELEISDKPIQNDKLEISDESIQNDKLEISDEPIQNDKLEISDEPIQNDKLEISDEPIQNDKLVISDAPEVNDTPEENNKPEDSIMSEENDKSKDTDKPEDKPVRNTRGTKRKANDDNDESTNTNNETTEQKENVDNDNFQKEMDDEPPMKISGSNIMGKGKRARVPNKRYSDILLSPNRRSGAKSHDIMEPEVAIEVKEEPLDAPVLTAISSPSLPIKKNRASLPKDNMQDPKFLKPFKLGWKRELVWRSTSTNSKRMGDIYYYTPAGKKVRSFREVSDHISNKSLSLDNFSFTKEALGLDDPEKEIIRDAKIAKSSDSFSESPAPKKIEIKKPKKVMSPKSGGADTPKAPEPVAVTPTRRRAAAIASIVEKEKPKETVKAVKETTPSANKKIVKMPLRRTRTPATKTPVGKTPAAKTPVAAKTPAAKTPVVKSPATKTPVAKTTLAKKPKLAIKTEEPMEVESPPATRFSTTKTTSKPCQPCSINCEGVLGIVPTLQCRLCLCLYHHECVGMSPSFLFPYVCKNCQDQNQATSPSSIVSLPPLTPINTLKSVATPVTSTTLPKLQRIPRPDSSDPVPVLQPLQTMPPLVEINKVSRDPPTQPTRIEMPKLTPRPPQLQEPAPLQADPCKSLVGSVTSWLPHNVKLVNSEEPTEAPRPQYVEYLAGRKFLVIPKHNFVSVSSGNTCLRPEDTIATPSAMQPTEVPISSASLGPPTEVPICSASLGASTSSTDVADPTPSSPTAAISEPAKDFPEVKKEPLSPTKAEEPQPSTPMEVDDTVDVCKVDSVEGPLQVEEEKNSGDAQDEASVQQAQNNQPKMKKRNLKLKSITHTNPPGPEEKNEAKFMENYLQNLSFGYNTMLYVFQYLKVQDLLRAGCVCTMWRDIGSHPILWRTVRMKNSQVHSFEGLANTLKKHGTVHLDLRKMLLPSNGDDIWPEFSKAIARVDTLRKIELCRCPATVVEQLAASNTNLEVINAVTIKCDNLNLDSFNSLDCVRELRLKSTSGLNINSLASLKELKTLKILSLTSVNELHKLDLSVIAELNRLESLDLGECTEFPKNFGQNILLKLEKLEKLRLEKGQGSCHTFEILEAVRNMKSLEQLELVNFDVKAGFDKALGLCTNIKKLMIIPTYISQSATTNNMVLSGVLRLQGSLTHFVWGVTLELLRVTELFVDQCEDSNKKEKKPTGNGDSIPVLKPVPDLTNGGAIQAASNPPQVEILPLPNLQKLLLNSLPTTRVKILKIPFHATWRQTLTDSV